MKHHRALTKPNAVMAQSGLQTLLEFLVNFLDQMIAIVFAITGGKVGR